LIWTEIVSDPNDPWVAEAISTRRPFTPSQFVVAHLNDEARLNTSVPPELSNCVVFKPAV
jgi:hypothetical protein